MTTTLKRVTRVEHLNPQLTPFTGERAAQASSWRMVDRYTWEPRTLAGVQLSPFPGKGYGEREIWHYATLMATIVFGQDGEFTVHPVSTGWGSVTDQQGMNKILSGCGFTMCRDQRGGGPRYEETNTYDVTWRRGR